jgi:hypothetical protein
VARQKITAPRFLLLIVAVRALPPFSGFDRARRIAAPAAELAVEQPVIDVQIRLLLKAPRELLFDPGSPSFAK